MVLRLFQGYVGNFPNRIYSLNVWLHKLNMAHCFTHMITFLFKNELKISSVGLAVILSSYAE